LVDLKAPLLRPFCTLEVEAGAVRSAGKGRSGERRIVSIAGGRVHGPGISGTILPGGADWQTVGEDGVVEMNARYAFETADGAVVEIFDRGYRHGPPEVMQRLAAREVVPPESYSMRSTMRLETGHPDYLWLNRMIFVTTGARTASGVQIDLYSVE
jgi:hypothetical protein